MEDADFFPNNRGLAVRMVVFDGKLPERSGSDIAGSLNGVIRSQRDRTEGGGHTGPSWCRDSCCV
jgi:hypothetical protein